MSSQPQRALSPVDTSVVNLVQVDFEGRFLVVASGAEFPCRVAEMSTAEMRFVCDFRPKLSEKVIVYLTELGRFEGYIEQHDPTGFSISMTLTKAKHKKLAEQLVWFGNRDLLEMSESRRHKRIVPLLQWTMVRLELGKEVLAKINDVSAESVKIEVNSNLLKGKLIVGSHIFVGSKAAEVTRLFDGGFVAKFDEPFEEGEVTEFIRL